MRCEIASWGESEVNCKRVPEGDCANCGVAHNYISLIALGSCSHLIDSVNMTKKEADLIAEVKFNDGDPKIYTFRVSKGQYFHFGK